MKNWKKRLAITGTILIGIAPASASAISLIFPPIIPDIEQPVCAAIQLFLVATPCTFTLSNEVMQGQQLLATAQNLKAAGGIGGTIAMVRGEIPTIEAAVHAATPIHAADAAASTGVAQTANVDNQIQASANTSAECDGELCIEQSIASSSTVAASEAAKSNQLHEHDVEQSDSAQIGFEGALINEFGPTAGLPAGLQ